MFEWVKRFKKSWRQFIHSKFGKFFICFSFAGIFMYLGGVLYAQIFDTNLSVLERFGLFLSAIVGVVGTILLLIEKLLKIETQEKILQHEEQKLLNLSKENSEVNIDNVTLRTMSLFYETAYPFDSIYHERESHYKHEKIVLADRFSDLMEKRIDFLRTNGVQNIKMIIDSGTTIATLLDDIGRKSSLTNNYWTKYIDIYTNNIRGLDHLLKYREKTNDRSIEYQKDRYKRLPFECNVLPGKVLSAFQAIVDKITFERLQLIKEDKDPYIIGITTGNYILWDCFRHEFMPMARAGLHPHFKSSIYHISNEVYVIAPLGKILKNERDSKDKLENLEELLNRFNIDLDFSKDSDYESQKLYKIVSPNLLKDGKYFNKTINTNDTIKNWIKKSILVTTKRSHGNMLWPHYDYLSKNFNQFNEDQDINFDSLSLEGPFLKTFKLDYIPNYQPHQINFEIPHENLRPFIKNYFETNDSFRTLLEKLKENKDANK